MNPHNARFVKFSTRGFSRWLLLLFPWSTDSKNQPVLAQALAQNATVRSRTSHFAISPPPPHLPLQSEARRAHGSRTRFSWSPPRGHRVILNRALPPRRGTPSLRVIHPPLLWSSRLHVILWILSRASGAKMKMNHLHLPAGGHLGRVYGSCHTDDRVRIQISSMSRYFTVLAHRSTPSISRCVDILFVYYTGTDLDTHACDENNIYYLERTGDNTIGRAQTSIYSTQRRFGSWRRRPHEHGRHVTTRPSGYE